MREARTVIFGKAELEDHLYLQFSQMLTTHVPGEREIKTPEDTAD